MTFFISRSDSINCITEEHIKNKKKSSLIKSLHKIIKQYTSRNFVITDIYGDNEFNNDDIRQSVLPAKLHICAANEHVPMVERCIRTIKEKARTMCHSVPYESYTRLMTRSLMTNVVKWMNAFPSSGGVVGPYSPTSILEGATNPDCNRKRIPFGSYALAYI